MLSVLLFVYNNLAVLSAASYHYDNYGALIDAKLRARRSVTLRVQYTGLLRTICLNINVTTSPAYRNGLLFWCIFLLVSYAVRLVPCCCPAQCFNL